MGEIAWVIALANSCGVRREGFSARGCVLTSTGSASPARGLLEEGTRHKRRGNGEHVKRIFASIFTFQRSMKTHFDKSMDTLGRKASDRS